MIKTRTPAQLKIKCHCDSELYFDFDGEWLAVDLEDCGQARLSMQVRINRHDAEVLSDYLQDLLNSEGKSA